MKLENEKVRNEKLYRVGYIPSIGKYIIACVVTWVAWYDKYFEITEEEYNSFGAESLDELANELRNQGSDSSRFLFSDKNEENTKEQQKLRDKLIADMK
ncbi:ABC transporter ATP-binding protein [Butyrivibrio sp. M55]|uniref:ABC transporter ATP-binding protein n=1 Tax=Butyrivibrio sp. M55 TaxID=1855323 RepID=UPI0008E61896|nr:ABC transporter ATP-binding protein [Butyrivibrio sp. M55]SFU75235.1 hypothetical protein SAMN05216540_10873 [Butyrivibrio sp. M55]